MISERARAAARALAARGAEVKPYDPDTMPHYRDPFALPESDKEKILCHRCRWGAAPGHLTRCNLPGLAPLMEWGAVSKAVAEDNCTHYKPNDNR